MEENSVTKDQKIMPFLLINLQLAWVDKRIKRKSNAIKVKLYYATHMKHHKTVCDKRNKN